MANNKLAYVYRIENIVNNKSYIGIARNKRIFTRWNEHVSASSKLGVAIEAYGLENFNFSILAKCENVSDDELFKIETDFIKQFNSIDNGYNAIHSKSQTRKQSTIENEKAQKGLVAFKDITYVGTTNTHKKQSFWSQLSDVNTCFPMLLHDNNYLTRNTSKYYKYLHVIFNGRNQRYIKITKNGNEYVTSNIMSVSEFFKNTEFTVEYFDNALIYKYVMNERKETLEISCYLLFDDEARYFEEISTITEITI